MENAKGIKRNGLTYRTSITIKKGLVAKMKKILASLFVLIIMLSMFPTALAAYGPSSADLKEIGSQIEYPKDKEYLSDYAYGTIIAPKGHSVYCYGSADMKGAQYTVADGEEVAVLARRGEMLCVIIPSQSRARWVREKYVDIYSGNIGTDQTGAKTFRGSKYGPGETDLKAIDSQIEYPAAKEYLSDYGYGVVEAKWGDTVSCYGTADCKGSKYSVPVGEEVVVIAERGDMLCMIIPAQGKACWISEANVYLYDESMPGNSSDTRSIYDYFSASNQEPSSADLEEIGSRIEYPRSREYWSSYVTGTVRAPKGHSVYCYGSADRKGSQYTVLDGETVVILASREEMLCVIIPSEERACWIKDEYVFY